jgi:hypothetical protein
MTPDDPNGSPTLPVRRGGREGAREITVAFRRYVEAVQADPKPTPFQDLEAALTLAQDIMGHQRGPEIDAALGASYSAPVRQLATAVRRAGRGAVAQPALLARAIVLARALERTGAGRRPGARRAERAGGRAAAAVA